MEVVERSPTRRNRAAGARWWVVRGVTVAALVAALAAGCAEERDEGPAAVAHPEASPPRVVEFGEVPLVEYPAPRDSLLVREAGRPGELTLLFYRGRGTARDGEGLAYVPDGAASRVLAVGSDLRVRKVVGGPSPDGGELGTPLSVAATPEGEVFVIDVEHPRGLLYYGADGEYVGAASPPVANPNLAAAPGGGLWASRSPYILGFEPTRPGDPLLYWFDPLEGTGLAVAEIETGVDPVAGRLVNAGSVAPGLDGTAYFAFLLRNEIRAYGSDGALRWRVSRVLPFEAGSPEMERLDGDLRLRARPVTQALSVAPDGLLYVLTAADSLGAAEPADAPLGAEASRPGGDGSAVRRHTTPVRRIEIYDPETGDLLRASTIPGSWTTLGVDTAGRVWRVDPEAVLASAPPPERPFLPSVTVETFRGDSVSLDEYRGRALLVNLWASWCEPCKRELPALKEYYESLSPEDRRRVEFLAISEDRNPVAARRFAEPMELPFPLFLGHGKMRESFRYLGLPYTLIVDYRGRVVEEIHGFGSEEGWRRLTSSLEREMERAIPGPAGGAVGSGEEADDHGAGDHDDHHHHGTDARSHHHHHVTDSE